MSPDREPTAIEPTEAQMRRAVRRALREADCASFDDLAAQAASGRYSSSRARMAWIAIGGWREYAADMGWRAGDRVEITLPDNSRLPGTPGRRVRTHTGTVVAVDLPGLPLGVHVSLDEPCNGTDSCYATHSELRDVAPGGS